MFTVNGRILERPIHVLLYPYTAVGTGSMFELVCARWSRPVGSAFVLRLAVVCAAKHDICLFDICLP